MTHWEDSQATASTGLVSRMLDSVFASVGIPVDGDRDSGLIVIRIPGEDDHRFRADRDQ